MVIKFTCSCGKVVKTSDDHAGKQGKCPQCGAVITIPNVAEEPVLDLSREQEVAQATGQAAAGLPRAGHPPPLPARKLVSFQPEKKGGTFCFQGTNAAALASEVSAFFTRQGYKLEVGAPANGIYGTGSDLMRMLLGGFVARYKFQITIEPQDTHVWLKIDKAMSGAMGGLLGVSKMNKEVTRIMEALQTHFA